MQQQKMLTGHHKNLNKYNTRNMCLKEYDKVMIM